MQTNTLKTMTLAMLCMAMVSCTKATNASGPCGDGESVDVGAASYCVYKEAIVIVGGFDCPASMPFRMDFERATVCGNHSFDNTDVPNDICARVFVPCTPIRDSDARVMEPDGGVFVCGGAVCSLPNATAKCTRDTQCEIAACADGFADCDAQATNGCEVSLNDSSNCGACGTSCSDRCCHAGECGTCPIVAACDHAASGDPNYPYCALHTVLCPGSLWLYDSASYACECSDRCVVGTTNTCPAALTGTAAAECLQPVRDPRGSEGQCHLTCDHGESCPTDMACIAASPNSIGSRRICVWLTPATCPPACEPATEVCDRQDNDCDLIIDEDCGACAVGFADCDGQSANGCETSLNTVPNCGQCGRTCSLANGSATCVDGDCRLAACDVGFGDCDADPANGCETALNTLTDCGGCNVACVGSSMTCVTGVCRLASL